MANIMRMAEQNIRSTVDARAAAVTVPVDEGVKQSPVDEGVKQSPVDEGVKQSPVDEGVKQSPVDEGVKQSPVASSSAEAEAGDPDYSWIDDLEPYTSNPVPDTGGSNLEANGVSTTTQQQPAPQQPAPQQPAPQQPVYAQQPAPQGADLNLDVLYENLEHLDSSVAAEIKQHVLDPQLGEIKAKLSDLEKFKENEKRSKQQAILATVNKELFEFNPKVDKVLNSKDFIQFVESSTSPYATESNYAVLTRAYYAGDAKYVRSVLEAFFASRSKPKPAPGIEAPQGVSNAGTVETKKGRRMSEAEYREKRSEILRAPKGAYPPNALRDLSDTFFKRGG